VTTNEGGTSMKQIVVMLLNENNEEILTTHYTEDNLDRVLKDLRLWIQEMLTGGKIVITKNEER
jgi:hypothetical protein